jgi:hypothetical protein
MAGCCCLYFYCITYGYDDKGTMEDKMKGLIDILYYEHMSFFFGQIDLSAFSNGQRVLYRLHVVSSFICLLIKILYHRVFSFQLHVFDIIITSYLPLCISP